jgi:hypothetical protein
MVIQFQLAGRRTMAAYFEIRYLTSVMIGCLLTACAGEIKLTGQSAEEFCSTNNGYELGSEGVAYTNVCPDVLAPAFLDGYQSGYAVHLAQLEVDAMERASETMSKELEDVCTALDTASGAQAQRLSAHRSSLTAELDELESEMAFRKTQLLQMRHSIAAND